MAPADARAGFRRLERSSVHRRPMLLFGLTLVLTPLGALLFPPGGAAIAPSATDTELMTVAAVLGDLHQQFFRPLNEADVLQGAWDGAVAAAQRSGAQVAALQAPDLRGDHAEQAFDLAYRQLDRVAAGKIDPLALGRAAIEGAAGSMHENHTYYLPPQRWSQRSNTSSQYGGIGVTLAQYNGGFYVGDVFAGSPAAGGGLQPGDRVVAVDGLPVDGISMDDLTSRIRGPMGSEVQLTVSRLAGWLQVVLQRQAIVQSTFQASVRSDGVGVLRLTSFPPAAAKLPDGQTVPQAFAKALDDFDKKGVSAWVLDLRGNGGGYLDTMSAIANLLLPAGAPYFVNRTQQGVQISRTAGGQHTPARPLSVLVDGGSASASEILSVALQENGRALVVGQKSAGVANAADLDSLPDGGGLSVTAVQTLTPVLRRPLDGQGVTPEIIIAPDAGYIPLGRDRQLDTAALAALIERPYVASAAGQSADVP